MNFRFPTGKFPKHLNYAKVLALYNSASKSNRNNYTISFYLAAVKYSKELCSHKYTIKVKNVTCLIAKFGYRQNYATFEALAEFTELTGPF